MSRARSMRPVPRVYDVQGPDLVMERLYGPTMADAIAAGDLAIGDGAGLLADLHRSPVPGRRGRRAVIDSVRSTDG